MVADRYSTVAAVADHVAADRAVVWQYVAVALFEDVVAVPRVAATLEAVAVHVAAILVAVEVQVVAAVRVAEILVVVVVHVVAFLVAVVAQVAVTLAVSFVSFAIVQRVAALQNVAVVAAAVVAVAKVVAALKETIVETPSMAWDRYRNQDQTAGRTGASKEVWS